MAALSEIKNVVGVLYRSFSMLKPHCTGDPVFTGCNGISCGCLKVGRARVSAFWQGTLNCPEVGCRSEISDVCTRSTA